MAEQRVIGRIMPLLRKLGEAGATRELARDLLVGLVNVDTTMRQDLKGMAACEEECFRMIEAAVRGSWGEAVKIERVPISPEIANYPDYTFPYFSADAEHPNGLPAEEVYGDRVNLVATLPGAGAPQVHLNAHVDIVKPWLAARVDGDVIYGRGACDDKGQCVALVLTLHFLKALAEAFSVAPAHGLTCQFVVEEETGGNGSLSLAIDKTRPFDTIVVCEATELRVHPANRGAVWYALTLDRGGRDDVSLVELGAECILALEDEGRRIYGESDHPLFPSRPVQTCHGIVGPWGSHPSGVNALVGLCLVPDKPEAATALAAAARPVADGAIERYVARYGDKTKEPDPDDPTGKKMKVFRHYDIDAADGHVWLGVYGKSGHMGSTPLLDGAITKASYIVRELVARREALCGAAGAGGFEIQLADAPPQAEQAPPGPDSPAAQPCAPTAAFDEHLVMEGGQGFVPTHDIADVKKRLTTAIAGAVEGYCKRRGPAPDAGMAKITFDKLHNNAYACSPDSDALRAALEAARATGIYSDEPIEGWKVSCDARLFADHRPEAQVLTLGAGSLSHAHSEKEQVRVSEIIKVAQTLAVFALTYPES